MPIAVVAGIFPSMLPAAPLRGYSKALISHLFVQPNASAPAFIVGEGATILADYDSFTLISVPEVAIERIKARAAAAGIGVAIHDEYDLLGLPGGTIDTRIGIVKPPGAELIAAYPSGKYGLYVLQLIGPPRPEWLGDISAAGGVLIDAVPLCGYLVALTPESAATVSTLPEVQFLEIYHPFLKAAMVDPLALKEQDVLVELAEAPGIGETVSEVMGILGIATQKKNRSGFYLFGKLKAQDLPRLLLNRLVIGVHQLTALTPSDERQATSLSSNVMTSGGNVIPTQPAGYASWLTSATACNVCGGLSDEGFIIGIADTGVDSGANGARHADLQPVFPASRVRYGGVFLVQRDASGICPAPPPGQPPSVCENPGVCFDCDGSFHGTFITGVSAGNANTQQRDSSSAATGFLLGTGIAPTAGILSTKKLNSSGISWLAHGIYDWATDATSRFVYIQNHSQNEYNANPSATGMYTQQSRDFDIAVRNSTGNGTQLSPIMLTVSAGNRHQDRSRDMFAVPLTPLLPPATSKNVIAVGGAENVRDSSEWRNDCNGFIPTDANSFRNIMADSKHGTLVQSGGHGWDTYNKPDLFAPASQIVSTRATDLSPLLPGPNYGCFGYGGNPPDYDPSYWIGTGTSFAAPVGAGAALVASRVYSAAIGGTPNPAAASPALLKAMLVGSARSMRTGIDKSSTATPQPAIGARPNAVQGFGRISLVDIVTHTPARQYFNQGYKFTASAQKWSATYPVSNVSQPVKIVLAWTDAPAQAGLGNVPTLIQNDLDLLVSIGDSTNRKTYAGNNLIESTQSPDEGEESFLYVGGTGNPDTKNNVETVIFYPNLAGVTQFTVVVQATLIGAQAIPDASCSGCPNQDFALFVYNAGGPISLGAPTNVVATAASSTTVNVTWSPVQGADSYEISRRDAGAYTVINNTTTGTSFTDTTASANTAYLYRVRALDPGTNPGNYSNPDLATTVIFNDDPLASQMTVVQATHVDQLRTAVNAVRATAGLGAASFTDPSLLGVQVKAIHIQELRSNLDGARSALSLPAVSYTDPSITVGSTVIKAGHVAELRGAVR
ncbi:MAG TPA: hypothetical protein VER58_21360 [Thermoanaerobaculia bacterium]|nr:hypothetical protein [Thermoanaerobaculia bacterium]